MIYVFLDLRDRENHLLVASCTHPDGGSNLQPGVQDSAPTTEPPSQGIAHFLLGPFSRLLDNLDSGPLDIEFADTVHPFFGFFFS